VVVPWCGISYLKYVISGQNTSFYPFMSDLNGFSGAIVKVSMLAVFLLYVAAFASSVLCCGVDSAGMRTIGDLTAQTCVCKLRR
jgi:hypothetical protein